MGTSQEVGTYVLPIIPSIEGIGPSIDRTLGKAFGNVGKQASQALAGGVRDGIAQAEADIRKSSEAIAKLRDKEADAAGRLRVAEERLNEVRDKGGSAAARAEEARERALRQHAAALRNVENETKSLETAQRRLESAQRDVARGPAGGGGWLAGLRGQAEQALSGLDSIAGGHGAGAGSAFLDGFGGAVASLGSKAGPIGIALAGVTTLGLGVGKELVDQVEAGMQTLQTRDVFAAKLGVDDATMDRIAKEASDAFVSGFGDSVPDNLKAGQFAIQAKLINPDATDAEIQHAIEQIQTLSTVMDADVQEVARGAGKLLITGVAKTGDEAFDLLTVGAQKGLDLTGDLVDTMEEYSTKFRDVGLSGKESLGLIAQLLEGGARNTDVAADALKEFSIRAVDNSKTTRSAFKTLGLDADDMANKFAAGGQSAHDAFDLVLDRLRDVSDPLQQKTTGVELFGTKWEDVGDAIKNADLSTAVTNLGKVDGESKTAADKVHEHASEWDLLGRNIKQSFDNFQTGFAESGFGTWLGTTLPGFLNDALFPKDVPTFPQAPGEALGTSGVYGPPQPAPLPVQGPGIPQPPTAPAAPLPPSVTGVLTIPVTGPPIVDPRIKAPVPRAEGGIDLGDWQQMPGTAHIGGPVYPNGLVRYREPSTGGEAYIPLAGGQRSIDIWQETGRQLGVWAFEQGGILGDNGGLLPFTEQLRELTLRTFPMIKDIGGYRAPDGYNEHSSGRALDVMIPNWQTPDGKALGNQVARWALSIPGVNRVMWQSSIIRPGGQVEAVPDRGSPTQNHLDHVHIFTDQQPAGSFPTVSFGAGLPGFGRGAGGGGGALPVQGPAGANVVSAFGNGYQAGVGTPGYNDLGEPGYYQTDPRQIAQAQRRADDAQQAIADADQRIVDAKQKRAELEDESRATAEDRAKNDADRAKADRAIADAERAAQRAREDAQWAQEDAADARKGKFTAAKKAQGDKGGTGDLSQIGGIFGAFLKETFGVDGSLFPDLASLMPIQMAGNALSAFKGPLLGALQGQLGIQQPGWEPGMPVQVPAGSGGGGGLPFGLIPNVFDVAGYGQPDMAPPGTPASGIGSGPAPGPIDQSRNVSIAVTAGPNEEQIANTVRREVASVDRLNTYAPPGMGG